MVLGSNGLIMTWSNLCHNIKTQICVANFKKKIKSHEGNLKANKQKNWQAQDVIFILVDV